MLYSLNIYARSPLNAYHLSDAIIPYLLFGLYFFSFFFRRTLAFYLSHALCVRVSRFMSRISPFNTHRFLFGFFDTLFSTHTHTRAHPYNSNVAGHSCFHRPNEWIFAWALTIFRADYCCTIWSCVHEEATRKNNKTLKLSTLLCSRSRFCGVLAQLIGWLANGETWQKWFHFSLESGQ